MDISNWTPTQGVSVGPVGDPLMEHGDWRADLRADSRQMIVNQIMESLKRHLPFSGHEGLQELMKIAVRFEEKNYTSATSQSDYLRKISSKMLAMESRSQNPMPGPMEANNGLNPTNPGSQVAPQVNIQGQQLPILVPSQSGQRQLLGSQSGNTGMQTNQHSVQQLLQSKVPIQQQNQQSSTTMLPTQVQQSQSQLQQQVMPQMQSQSGQLQQQMGIQQQPNLLQHDIHQRLQTAGGYQQQNIIDQPKLYQRQRAMPEASSTSLDSTDQTRSVNGGDWQEEVYQKIKAIKDPFDEHRNMMFSPDDFAHLKIPLENILSATPTTFMILILSKKMHLIRITGDSFCGRVSLFIS